MTISLKQVNTAGQRVFMGTLVDHADLHQALAEVAEQHQISCATFELLGGLHEVELTAYDFEERKRLPALRWKRALEIISGHGTISQLEGKPHIHTHMTLSFRDETSSQGIQLIGGHVSKAVIFAVEFTLTAYDGNPIQRHLHAPTGLMLWQPEK